MKNLEKLQELAAALPESVRANAVQLVTEMGEVVEGIGDRPVEWRASFLKVVQGTSDRAKLPKGTAIGAMLIQDEVLEAPFEVIPLRSWMDRQMWNPDPENARMLCNSPDSKVGYAHGNCNSCQFGKFDEERKKSDCNKGITVMCISADFSKIFQVKFSKSNYAGGAEWNKLMSGAKVAPYKRTYTLHTETSKKSKNVEVLLASNGKAVEKESLEFLTELFNRISADRDEHLVAFYEYVKGKTAGPAGIAVEVEHYEALDAPQDSNIVDIDSSPAEAPVKAKTKAVAVDNTDYNL